MRLQDKLARLSDDETLTVMDALESRCLTLKDYHHSQSIQWVKTLEADEKYQAAAKLLDKLIND